MLSFIRRINSFSFEKYSFEISYFLIVVIALLYSVNTLHNFGFIVLIFVSVLFVFLSFFLYLFLKKKGTTIEIHKLYLIIILFIGVFYILGFPPSQLPDDNADYLRSLEVSDLHFTSVSKKDNVGRMYPKIIRKVYESKNYQDYLKNANLKLEGPKTFLRLANKSLYAFVCYVPQAIGVGIGKIFNLPIVFQSIFGKICNFLLYVCLTYLSIKYIPTKKMLLFFICLLPMTVQEAASLSPDCMTIVTAIALQSFVLWSRSTKTNYTMKHYIALTILNVCLSLSKIVYLLICFLILLIPKKCFGTEKNKYLYCISSLILVVSLNLLWLKISSSYLYTFINTRGSNSSIQLKFILQSPYQYVLTLFATIDQYSTFYLEQIVGHSLGSFSVKTSYIFVIMALVVLFRYLFYKDSKKSDYFSNFEKIIILLLIVGTILLIFTSLYLQWTPVYSTIVEGVQGRYFIPLLPLVSFFFISKKPKKEDIPLASVSIFILFNIISIISIYNTYL